ncbi:flagellar protein FlaG [Kiloniella sp.]|uniref:flagellar protein FlaG n=1 Tax=Kiloniella sp. TaxID=1938587 RepID=UPI003A92FB17
MSELTIPKQPTQSVSNISPQGVVSRQKIPTSTVSAAALSLEKISIANSVIDASPVTQVSQTMHDPEAVVASLASNIMTYRDSESGRLVVRLIDEDNNAVISEFPSKTMLGNYPKQSNFPLEVNTSLDTKA